MRHGGPEKCYAVLKIYCFAVPFSVIISQIPCVANGVNGMLQKRAVKRRFVKSVFKYNPSVSLRDPAPLAQGSLFFYAAYKKTPCIFHRGAFACEWVRLPIEGKLREAVMRC